MDNIFKYLITKIFTSAMIIIFAITLLMFLLQSLRFLDWVTNRGVSIFTVLYVSYLTFPSMWIEIIPFAVLLSIVFTWNYLTSNQELIIIQATGAYPIKIYSSMITIGLIFAVISFYIAFYMLPNSHTKYQELRSNMYSNYNIKIFEPEKFVNISEGTIFYIKNINGNKLTGIFIYSYNPKNKKETFIYAEDGYVDFKSDKVILLLNSTDIQEISLDGSVNFLRLDKYIFDFDKSHKYIHFEKKAARQYNLSEIFNVESISYLNKLKSTNISKYNEELLEVKREIVKRINIIYFSIFLAILSAYFFSIRQFSRYGNIKTFIQTISIGLLFKIANIMAMLSESYTILIMPLIVSLILGLIMIIRIIFPPSLKEINNAKFFA